MKGYIHSFESFGTLDGPGTRFIIFVQGCPIRCVYCHNPDTWDIKNGKKISANKIIKKIKSIKNYLTNGGVTISGGEPLLQPKFVLKLIKKIHKLKLSVAIDTAGTVFTKQSRKVLKLCDLVLLDIKALNNVLCKKLTGSSNCNTLKTLDYCQSINKDVWIRHVLVPNYTLEENNIKSLAKYLSNYTCVKKVEFLPFSKLGEHKYKQLNFPYSLYKIKEPTLNKVKQITDLFFENYKNNI